MFKFTNFKGIFYHFHGVTWSWDLLVYAPSWTENVSFLLLTCVITPSKGFHFTSNRSLISNNKLFQPIILCEIPSRRKRSISSPLNFSPSYSLSNSIRSKMHSPHWLRVLWALISQNFIHPASWSSLSRALTPKVARNRPDPPGVIPFGRLCNSKYHCWEMHIFTPSGSFSKPLLCFSAAG